VILRQTILVAGMFVIASCSGQPEDCEVRDLLSEVTSPDSTWSASLYANVCAAGLVTVPSVTAELRPAHSKATGYPGEGVVFGMDDFGPTSRSALRLDWLNAHTLRIVTPSDASIGTQLSSYRGVAVNYTYEPDDPVVRQCLKNWLSDTSKLNKPLMTWPEAKQRCLHRRQTPMKAPNSPLNRTRADSGGRRLAPSPQRPTGAGPQGHPSRHYRQLDQPRVGLALVVDGPYHE